MSWKVPMLLKYGWVHRQKWRRHFQVLMAKDGLSAIRVYHLS